MRCRKSKIIFQDHNMPLTCENVELRGFEPLTFCMPYKLYRFAMWLDMVLPAALIAGRRRCHRVLP